LRQRVHDLIRAALREPLLHFLVLGGGIYAADRNDEATDRVVITRADVERQKERARSAGLPVPEDRALAEAMADEEILVREARALRLDAGDPVVRARLIQKMELLLQPSPHDGLLELRRKYDPVIDLGEAAP
jgi:hypothetical protein